MNLADEYAYIQDRHGLTFTQAVALHVKAERAQAMWESLEFSDEEAGILTEDSEVKWLKFLDKVNV